MGTAPTVQAFVADQTRFLVRLLRQPKTLGALAPSSRALARAMAAQIPDTDGPVIELGPGTGAITEAILARGIEPERLTAIEHDPHFARLIADRFPRVRVIAGDAFDLAHTLGPYGDARFAAVLSGLPLLNFPRAMRSRLLAQISERLAPGAPFVQFSYGLQPPAAPEHGFAVRQAAFVAFNLPPARVWVYRKT